MPRHPTVLVPNIGPMDHAWDLLGEWQAEFERRWAELQRRIMERIEEEIRREIQRRFDLLCGTAPTGLVFASGLVWWRRRRRL